MIEAVVLRASTCLAMIVVLAISTGLRADQISVSAPQGSWSVSAYQAGVDTSEETSFGLGGSGILSGLSLGPWSSQGIPGSSTDLAWSPDRLTLTPGFGPMEIVWTASTSGDFTLHSTVSPNSKGGVALPFSGVISVNAGDSLSFVVLGDTGFAHPLISGFSLSPPSGFDAQFGPFAPDPVPEPSRSVALASIGMLALGVVFFRYCRRKGVVRFPASA
jgi:hypothetical protein